MLLQMLLMIVWWKNLPFLKATNNNNKNGKERERKKNHNNSDHKVIVATYVEMKWFLCWTEEKPNKRKNNLPNRKNCVINLNMNFIFS